MIIEDGELSQAQKVALFKEQIELAVTSQIVHGAVVSDESLSGELDYKLGKVVEAVQAGGDVQLAVDEAWLAFHDLFPG